MFASDKPYTLDRVVRMVLGLALLVGTVWVLGFLADALIPFVASLLLAYLFNPLTSALERLIKSRALAVFLTVAGVLALMTATVWLVVPKVVAEFAAMGSVLKQIATNADLAGRLQEYLPADVWQWLKDFAARPDVQSLFSSAGAADALRSAAGKLMPGVQNVLQGTLSVLGGFLSLGVILLYLVFLLADFGRIEENWQEYLPESWRGPVSEFAHEFEATMRLYFRGQVTIALLVGVLLSIGFALIGLPLAVVLGMLTGILNVAPYLGTLGLVPGVFLGALHSLEAGQSPLVGIGLVLLVFAVVQAIQEIVLVPKIQGDSLGLSPWMILLSLSIWGKLLGFLGLLIALPMTCLCLSYYRRMLKRE
jgi:predicted PurR-regulated permease PerM